MRKKILLVDDEQAILFAMTEYFTTEGFDVASASNKEEAQALLAHHRYHCLIADLRLSHNDGLEGLEVIKRARGLQPGIKSIVLTAHGSPEIEHHARLSGADVFLKKPQPLSQVSAIVSGLLGENHERI